MDREAWRAADHGVGHDWATELNWTDLKLVSQNNSDNLGLWLVSEIGGRAVLQDGALDPWNLKPLPGR